MTEGLNCYETKLTSCHATECMAKSKNGCHSGMMLALD